MGRAPLLFNGALRPRLEGRGARASAPAVGKPGRRVGVESGAKFILKQKFLKKFTKFSKKNLTKKEIGLK